MVFVNRLSDKSCIPYPALLISIFKNPPVIKSNGVKPIISKLIFCNPLLLKSIIEYSAFKKSALKKPPLYKSRGVKFEFIYNGFVAFIFLKSFIVTVYLAAINSDLV